jgi:hypothetical protein
MARTTDDRMNSPFAAYRRFGAGGAKLIWGEAAAVALEARANPRQLVIGDSTIAGIARNLPRMPSARVVDTFGTDTGLVVGLQLTHSGATAIKNR